MKLCECGCGKIINDNVRFFHGHNRKGKTLSDFHKKLISTSNTGKIRSKEVKDKIRTSVKKQWNDESSTYHSENFKSNRKKFHDSRIGVERKKDTKVKIGLKQKENWNNPNHLFNSKTFRNKLSNIHKEIWKDLESNYNSEQRSDKISKTIKHLYTTEDFLKKYQNGLKVYKNKLESKFETILKKLNIFSFKFVGDRSFWINGRNPDFINEDQKMVIEIFGDYWHGNERTGINNSDHELDRINHYKMNGYKSIIIWEHEINNIDELSSKILEFMKGH